MAIDQHYDPRFLLKGFQSKRKDKTVFVWLFQKDSLPVETSTRNIGHAHLFYGRQGPDSLDACITVKETKEYSGVVERVRNDKKISPSDKDILAEFVYFQTARTRSTREQYRTEFVSGSKKMRQERGAPEGMEQFYRDTLHPDNKDALKEISNRIKEEAKKQGRPLSYQQQQLLARQLLRKYGEETAKSEAPKKAFALDVALSAFEKRSDKVIKESHNKGLEQWLKTLPDPGPGLNRYRQLHWSVQKLEDNALILSDAVVLYREENSSQLSAGIGKGNLILLPLSHNLLLIGMADEAVKLPSLDEINRSSAELSCYFFVSSCWSQREDEYQKLIGKRAPTTEKE